MSGHGVVKTQPVIVSNHYSNIVVENQGNPKALWNCFKKILHRSSVAVLPDCTNKTDLANTFCKFFYDKILKIRSTLHSSTPSSVIKPNPTKNTLSSFTPVSEEDLLKILKSLPSKSCDMIDHSLLHDCLHDWFGLDGTVLLWIRLYLSNRKQKIKIGDSFSEAVILQGSQGSVLGALLFTLYTSQVISKFNVTHHLYASIPRSI